MNTKRKWLKSIAAVMLAMALCVGLVPFGQLGGVFAADDGVGISPPTGGYIVNGDFETGDATGWTVSDSKFGYVKTDEGAKNNKTRIFRIENKGDEAVSFSMEQTIHNVPAGEYYVALEQDGDKVPSGLSIKVNDVVKELPAATGWDAWTKVTTDKITLAEAGDITITVSGQLAAGYWGDLDNFVLHQCEEELKAAFLNGDFEDGEEATGWTVSDSKLGYVKTDEGAKNNKTRIFRIENKGDKAVPFSMAQTISNVPAGEYCVVLEQDGDTVPSGLSIKANDVVKELPATTGWDVWTKVTTDKITLEEAGDIALSISGDLVAGYWGDLDNIALVRYEDITAEPDDSTAVEADIFVKKVPGLPEGFINGMDVSSYIVEKDAGVKFYDFEGKELSDQGFFDFLHKECDVNYIRLRVWNNPYDAQKRGYGGGNNDVDKAITMGQWATKAGMKVLIDFHYSDFWADPAKQQAPKAWEKMTLEQKKDEVSKFTTDSLNKILDAGVDVGMVQVGNETNNGIAGVTGMDNMCVLFKAGCEAIDAIEAKRNITILSAVHFTNPESSGRYAGYAESLDKNKVPYDIFASSYYPEWHGTLENLTAVLKQVADKYGKMVMVAETAYPYTLEAGDEPGTVDVSSSTLNYNTSVQGQAHELRDVINAVKNVGEKGIGVMYWEPAWIPVSRCDSTIDAETAKKNHEANRKSWLEEGTGWASEYGASYDTTEDVAKWWGGSAADHKSLFDFSGHPMASIRVFKYVRTGAKTDLKVDYIKKTGKVSITVGEKLALPEKVTAVYNDNSTKEAAVTWDTAGIDINVPGKHTVEGVASVDGQTCKTSLELEILPENCLVNGGFEEGNTGWKVENTVENGAVITEKEPGNGHSGNWHLHFWAGEAYEYTVSQTVTGLKPGIYAFSGFIQGGNDTNGDETSQFIMFASTAAGNREVETGVSGYQNYANPIVNGIVVGEDGTVTVGVRVKAVAGAWGGWDDFSLYQVMSQTTNVTGEKTPEPQIETSLPELMDAVLTEDEKKEFDEGAIVDIAMDVKDIGSEITVGEAGKIESLSKEKGYTVGKYLDLQLLVTVNGKTRVVEQAGGKLSISIPIPEELLNKNADMVREYGIIRIHDGLAELLDTTVKDGVITFETDKFSTYAIVYKDGPKNASTSAPNTNKPADNADTGDNSPILLWVVLLAVAVAGVAAGVVARRRAKR